MSLAQTMSQARISSAKAVRLAPKTTAGSKVGKAIGAVPIPKTVNPHAFFTPPARRAAPAQTAINPYDAFNVGNPYDPATIHQTALTGYQQDTDQAAKLAQMGYLTPAQIDAQSANRAAQQQALGSSLAAAMSGIQRVNVDSGNAGAAGLAATDAATTATGDRAQALAGSTPASTAVADAGTRAVLAAQTAGTGNMYGGLEAAALSSGDQAAKQAYATGDTLKQTQAADQQKSLASLMSQIAPVSTREASMTDANTKAMAADKATQLTIWQNLQNQELQAKASGDKRAIAAAQLQSKEYLAGISDKTKREIGAAANTTRVKTATIGADSRVTAAKIASDSRKQAALISAAAKKATASGGKPPTVSQRLAVNKQIAKIMGSQGGVKTPAGQVTTGYTVTLGPRMLNGKPDIVDKGQTTPITVDAATGKSLKVGDPYPVYPGQTVTALAPKTKTGSASVKNAPSTWTKWKRAHAAVMTSFGMDRTTATQYMAASGYPAPPSK